MPSRIGLSTADFLRHALVTRMPKMACIDLRLETLNGLTLSGRFTDLDSLQEVLDHDTRVPAGEQLKNAFFTIQPTWRLDGDTPNQIRQGGPRASTNTVCGLYNLLLDIDTDHDQAASDSGMAAAQELLDELLDFLRGHDMGAYTVSSSGHGYHVLLALSEWPTSTGRLLYQHLHRFLCQRFAGTDAAHLCHGTRNVCQMQRLPGTWNRKHEPYRRCEVLDISDGTPVTMEQAQALLDQHGYVIPQRDPEQYRADDARFQASLANARQLLERVHVQRPDLEIGEWEEVDNSLQVEMSCPLHAHRNGGRVCASLRVYDSGAQCYVCRGGRCQERAAQLGTENLIGELYRIYGEQADPADVWLQPRESSEPAAAADNQDTPAETVAETVEEEDEETEATCPCIDPIPDVEPETVGHPLCFTADPEIAEHVTWPEDHPDMYYGIVGDAVSALWRQVPYIDPPALALALITTASAVYGRQATLHVRSWSSHPFIFAVLFGISGGGKGVNCGWAQRIVGAAYDELHLTEFAHAIVEKDLNTGAGLLARLCDPSDDETFKDQRMLAYVAEAGSLLCKFRDESNDLSCRLRNAWDLEPLRNLTRGEPLLATNYSLSVLCGVTVSDFVELVQPRDLRNGTLNRFMYCFTHARYEEDALPLNVNVDELIGPVVQDLVASLHWFAGRQPLELRIDPSAEAAWRETDRRFRTSLARNPAVDDTYADMQTRARANLMRAMAVYALLDRSDVILARHIAAASALVGYCQASTRMLTRRLQGGGSLLDRAIALIEEEGELTRTQIYRLSNNRARPADVMAVFDALEADGCRLITGQNGKVTRCIRG